jgi:nucleotide-binding universal stress UspA family protein
MKKILIATDFSANAKHAAEYGYAIASQLKAGVILCNTSLITGLSPNILQYIAHSTNKASI